MWEPKLIVYYRRQSKCKKIFWKYNSLLGGQKKTKKKKNQEVILWSVVLKNHPSLYCPHKLIFWASIFKFPIIERFNLALILRLMQTPNLETVPHNIFLQNWHYMLLLVNLTNYRQTHLSTYFTLSDFLFCWIFNCFLWWA